MLAELLSQSQSEEEKNKNILGISNRMEINAGKLYHKVKERFRSERGHISQL